jgi:HSP20 family protein
MWEDEDDQDERSDTAIDRFFSQALAEFGGPFFDIQSGTLRPLFRLEVTDDSVTVAVDLPGVKKEDVQITCTDDVVSVEAEIMKSVARKVSGMSSTTTRVERYSKKIRLPVRVDPNRATAKFKNGIVVVKLPILRGGKAIKIVDG